MNTWHMHRRWYASHLHVVTTDIQAFVPLWHKGLHPNVQEIKVLAGGDSLLHVCVYCKSRAIQVLPKSSTEMALSGPHSTKWTCDWLQHLGWEVMDHHPSSLYLVPSDF